MTPSAEEFQRLTRELQLKFTRFYSFHLTRHHLTFPQFSLLSMLYHGGSASMSELAGKLMISLPAVTHLVDRLENLKFVKRMAHAHDRRIHMIELHKTGSDAVERTQGRVQALFLETLTQLSSHEREAVRRFYEHFSARLETAILEESARAAGTSAGRRKKRSRR